MSDFITIGRTHYYTVRKGTLQYRVAEGKRLADPDHCWMVSKDSESGKSYYVNNSGVRRWHLPDIFLTEAERQEEVKELLFRRERKAKIADGGATDESEAKAPAEDEEAKKVDFASRDRLALSQRANREWDANPEGRRRAFKIAKGTLAPYLNSGEIDEKTFATIVSTCCSEFFASKSKLGNLEETALKNAVNEYAQQRIDEKNAKEAYRKMNAELMEKTARLEAERKSAVNKMTQMQKAEDAMKDEIFRLRAHKQDALLQSFKRLTRAGLVQTYWSRWKTYKGVVEAQLHVRARERRALEMNNRNESLEKENKELKVFVKSLQERVQKAEGRDVIAMMLKQSGLQMMGRVFALWQRFAEDSKKEKQYHEARMQISNCPNCRLRDLDNERVRERLNQSFRLYHEKEAALVDSNQSRGRLERELDEKTAMIATLQEMVRSLEAAQVKMSQKLAGADQAQWEVEIKNKALENEIEKLQFELMSHNDFTSQKQTSGVNRIGTSGGGEGPSTHSLSLGNFFGNESAHSAIRLHEMVVARSVAKAEQAQQAALTHNSLVASRLREPTPTRGKVFGDTEAALAPDVRAFLRSTPGKQDDEGNRSPHRSALAGVPPPPTASPPESLIYRRPLTDTDSSPDDQRSTLLGANEEEAVIDEATHKQQYEDQKCDRCGFRRKLTPFCPKDGSRHCFQGFSTTPLMSKSLVDSAVFTSASNKVSKAEKATDLLPPGIPPPEFQEPSFGRTSSAAIQQSSMMTQQLRSTLDLDPSNYQPRHSLYHTLAAPLIPDREDAKSVSDYIRNTRMTVEMRQRQEGTPLAGRHTSLRAFRAPIATPQVGGDVSGGRNPAWGQIFDYNDVTNGTLGLTVTDQSHFGVVTANPLETTVAGQKYAQTQKGTPSFYYGSR